MEDDKGPAIACVYAMRGLLTINAGQLAVEEGEVRVYFDIHYPVTASGETVLARMRAAVAPYGLRVWKRHEMRPVYMDKNSRVIRACLRHTANRPATWASRSWWAAAPMPAR